MKRGKRKRRKKEWRNEVHGRIGHGGGKINRCKKDRRSREEIRVPRKRRKRGGKENGRMKGKGKDMEEEKYRNTER